MAAAQKRAGRSCAGFTWAVASLLSSAHMPPLSKEYLNSMTMSADADALDAALHGSHLHGYVQLTCVALVLA